MKEKIVLKSTHPEDYPDLVVECRVIQNDKIGEYLKSIPNSKKFYAYKSASVKARKGVVGEQVCSDIKTIVDGKEYILKEEVGTVKERPFGETTAPDMVITNDKSTSNEEYVVNMNKFANTYEAVQENGELRYLPIYDSRLLTQVDENVIIMTAWGEPAICLAGGYIVTYDEATNDYNALEKDAFKSTYTKEEEKSKQLIK